MTDPDTKRKHRRWFHLAMLLFWIAMIPAAFFTGWIDSVRFVAALSLWALVEGHWSAWEGAHGEHD